ncbi:MAG TPA: hypothetical protein PLY40_03220 [Bacillota bacterium]|nr:hypothetical protein [Bacillota bacterium]
MAVLCAVAVTIALLLGYRLYALGVALATPIAWLLYRWQIMALSNLEGLPPRRATARLLTRSLLRLIVSLTLLGLSILGGETFLFGVLTGLLFQIMAYTGQALYTIVKKGGKA